MKTQPDNQTTSESPLDDAACSPVFSDTPETDQWRKEWAGDCPHIDPIVDDAVELMGKMERERNTWLARYADAVERLEGKLHCAEDCKCSGRREVKMLRSFILENAQAQP